MKALFLCLALAAAVLESGGGPRGAAPPEGQSAKEPQILFRMDYAASAFPDAGWHRLGRKRYDQRWTAVHVPGGGYKGRDAVELREIGTGEHDQHTWGWDGDVGPPPNGQTRYYRWRFYQTPESNGRGIHGSGNVDSSYNKFLIVGQGGPGRIVVENKFNLARRMYWKVWNGHDNTESDFLFRAGEWQHCQLEISSGGWKLWVNDMGRPLLTAKTSVDTTKHEYVILGGYNNHGLAKDGINNFRIGDFEVGTTFDPNWTGK